MLESCVIGDWAPPSDEPAAKKPRAVRRCTVKTYTAYASKPRQLAIRLRYLKMLQVAFTVFEETGTLTWETTWDDLFPKVPTDERLKPFYGSLKDHEGFFNDKVPDT